MPPFANITHTTPPAYNKLEHPSAATTSGSPATPSASQATLVTNNTREFAKVPGLQLDNWAAAT